MSSTSRALADFTVGYAHTMLWANTMPVVNGEPTGDSTDPYAWHTPSMWWALEAFDVDSRASIEADCEDFFTDNLDHLDAYVQEYTYTRAGADFALTRNGHGAGFWDRGLDATGDCLADAARSYGGSGAWYDASDDAEDMEVHLDSL